MIVLNISYEDFLLFTPVQLSIAFELKRIQKEEELQFQMHQTRLINFYSVYAMSGTKYFQSPEKLYGLPNEHEHVFDSEFLQNPMPEEDREFLRKLKFLE